MIYDHVIGLGGNCDVAHHWRRYSGQDRAMPLDWWVTPFLSVEKLLSDRFERLFEPANLHLVNKGMTVMCRHYGVGHHHDFPRAQPRLLIDTAEIARAAVSGREKYQTLTTRFYQACRPPNRVLFLRSWRDTLEVPANNATAPDNLTRYDFAAFVAGLEHALPDLDFRVLFINYGVQSSNHPRAMFHNVVDKGDPQDWAGSPGGWDEMFRHFVGDPRVVSAAPGQATDGLCST